MLIYSRIQWSWPTSGLHLLFVQFTSLWKQRELSRNSSPISGTEFTTVVINVHCTLPISTPISLCSHVQNVMNSGGIPTHCAMSSLAGLNLKVNSLSGNFCLRSKSEHLFALLPLISAFFADKRCRHTFCSLLLVCMADHILLKLFKGRTDHRI